MKTNFRIYFILVWFLASCAVGTPNAAPTLTITPTLASTPTLLPASTATSTPEAPGVIAGMDVTKYGFGADELELKGNEIVYAATGEVAARYNKKIKEYEWKADRAFKDRMIGISRQGPQKNGYELDDSKHNDVVRQQIFDTEKKLRGSVPMSTFTIRTDNTNKHYTRIYFVPYEGEGRATWKKPESGYLYVELPPTNGSDIGEILKIQVFDLLKGNE